MRRWRVNYLVLTAGVVHLVWGVILFFSTAPLRTTPLGHFPVKVGWAAGLVYVAASIMAFVPHIPAACRWLNRRWSSVPKELDTHFVGLLLTLPQQFLLMLSFYTALGCIISGAYPDGYVPDKYGSARVFIFCDQLWPTMGMAVHTISLLDWYWWSRT